MAIPKKYEAPIRFNLCLEGGDMARVTRGARFAGMDRTGFIQAGVMAYVARVEAMEALERARVAAVTAGNVPPDSD